MTEAMQLIGIRRDRVMSMKKNQTAAANDNAVKLVAAQKYDPIPYLFDFA